MWDMFENLAWIAFLTALSISGQITSNNETVVAGRVKRAVAGQDILIIKDEVMFLFLD
jgi:hypothetical protein